VIGLDRNPHRSREFEAHWFETGTPTFLLETLVERGVSALALDRLVGSARLLGTFDVDSIPTEALLFETGYLTIEATDASRNVVAFDHEIA